MKKSKADRVDAWYSRACIRDKQEKWTGVLAAGKNGTAKLGNASSGVLVVSDEGTITLYPWHAVLWAEALP